ncbi:MAG TPA: hypothetical protein VHL09_03605, partial [Dehalococcoidia bacterium]|nr:hypothetical protein [Dehalococcoidia bacterium]
PHLAHRPLRFALLLIALVSLIFIPSIGQTDTDPAAASDDLRGPEGRPVQTGAALARRGDLPAFGMSVIHFENQDVAKARQVGAGSILVGLYWSDIEPVRTDPPTYNWATADRNIGIAVNNGLEPFILITGNPSWADFGPHRILTADGRNRLAQMAAAAAQRYQTIYPGRVRMWSFYNEPDCNGPTNSPPLAVPVPSSCYGEFGGEYTKMLQAVYPALKAADPNALVAMGGLAFDNFGGPGTFSRRFLDDVLATGGAGYFDLMNFHYYTGFRHVWNPYGPDVIGKTNYIRGVMAAYGVDKPIVLTEIGEPAARSAGREASQADYVIQGLARAFAAGIDLVLWYEMVDAPGTPDGFGLIAANGAPKPGYTAYQVLSQKVTGLTSSGSPWTDFPGIEAYSFRSGDGSRWEVVAWSADGATRTMRVPGDRVIRTERTCAATMIRDADDGQIDGVVTVGVGSSPVILDLVVPAGGTNPWTAAHRVLLPLAGRSACS